jgi:UDP:flavonoid glycosyltransferase YjiC (YdhE family)
MGMAMAENLSSLAEAQNITYDENSGVLVMNLDSMRKDNVQEKLVATAKYGIDGKGSPMGHDQNTLNVLCRDRIKFLDLKFNTFSRTLESALNSEDDRIKIQEFHGEQPNDVCNDPVILHFVGVKPRNFPATTFDYGWWEICRLNPFYEEIFRKYTSSRVLSDVDAIIKCESFRYNGTLKVSNLAMKKIKIVISTIFQNSGDATRAIEIAKAIQEYAPADFVADIIFISRGSRFEKQAVDLGFKIYHAEPPMKGIQYLDDFESRFGELIGNAELAREILQGEIDALKQLQPDILIYGFWPIASIAKRMAIPDCKSIAFLPLPLTQDFLKCPMTFPDEMPLSRLPFNLQKVIMGAIPKFIKARIPALRHSNIRRAAENLGWRGEKLVNIFKMLASDLYLINDFPVFYDTSCFAKNILFTGPLYSESSDKKISDPRINEILSPENKRIKIFCTLGSSGSKQKLLEVIKMFNSGDGKKWSGIVLCPPAICPIQEARDMLNNENVYITDAFVPAKEINQKSDLVICHGGQGTLQTAIMSGVPLIGYPGQPEQKINLQHLQDFGAAVMMSSHRWTAQNIRRQVASMMKNHRYKCKALELKNYAENLNAYGDIGSAVWSMVKQSDNGKGNCDM